MGITITTGVSCDICGDWIEGAYGPSQQVRQARKEAEKEGWLRCGSPFDGHIIDACPICTEKYNLPQPRRLNAKNSG